jgi:ATP-dependent DNA ligase
MRAGHEVVADILCRGEGLVVKKVDCTYQTNSRSTDWVKVKPE